MFQGLRFKATGEGVAPGPCSPYQAGRSCIHGICAIRACRQQDGVWKLSAKVWLKDRLFLNRLHAETRYITVVSFDAGCTFFGRVFAGELLFPVGPRPWIKGNRKNMSFRLNDLAPDGRRLHPQVGSFRMKISLKKYTTGKRRNTAWPLSCRFAACVSIRKK
jgi:hypothetical protein